MKKVLVCGGRHYKNADAVVFYLDSLMPIDEIIEGGATGADSMARVWAVCRNVPCRTFEADWKGHGPAAGPMRNREMLVVGQPTVVLAFPGGKGTEDMCTKSEAAGVPVIRAEE